MEYLFDTFREMIASDFMVELERVTLDARFREDFQADSLDLIEFMLEVERKFNIKLQDAVLRDLTTVKDAYEFLLKKLQERGN